MIHMNIFFFCYYCCLFKIKPIETRSYIYALLCFVYKREFNEKGTHKNESAGFIQILRAVSKFCP